MDAAEVLSGDAELELTKGFDKRHSFDIADRSTQFDDAHLRSFRRIAVYGHLQMGESR